MSMLLSRTTRAAKRGERRAKKIICIDIACPVLPWSAMRVLHISLHRLCNVGHHSSGEGENSIQIHSNQLWRRPTRSEPGSRYSSSQQNCMTFWTFCELGTLWCVCQFYVYAMFRDIKPTFGQSSTTTSVGGFGSSNMNSPFGQSTFGKTTTSGFTAPAFGSASTSLFGSNTSTSSGLFGGLNAPVFGQAPTTQSSGFGFGTNTTSNNLFGNQQNANTSLFGGNTSSAFGQNKPAFGSFVTPSTGLFGQQQQPQTTSLFGQPSASSGTGLFGSGSFGNTANQTLGTPIKFVPTTGTDTMAKGGLSQPINTRHHCITCMKEYEFKSLEELRLEDYALNRKGPQTATQQTSLFGTSTQPSLFGAGTSTSTGGSSLFGENKQLFSGGTSMGFGTNTGVFGSNTQQAGSIFSKPGGFGAVTTTTASGFAFNTPSTTNPFGATSQPKPFGAVAPQTSLFGATPSQPSAFGTQNTGFGVFASQPNQSIGLFNQNKSPFTVNTTSTGFTFGQNTATNQTQSIFGKPTGTGTGFGSNFGTNSAFGGANMFGSNQNAGLFNQSAFGKPNNFSFGNQSTPATSTLGTGVGGQTMFGTTGNKPGSMFGTGTSMFGGGTTGFGSSTSTFGMGTSLGSSWGLGGQSLLGGTATNTTPSQQGNISVHEQMLALATMPFGDTPLFRNLLPASSKSSDLLKPTSPAPHKVAQKASSISNQYKVSPRSTTKIRVKPVSTTQLSKKALFDGLDEDVPAQLENFSPLRSTKRLVLKTKPVETEGSSTVAIGTEITNSCQESDKENNEVIHDQPPAEETWLLGKGGNANSKEDNKNADTQSPRRSIELTPDVGEVRLQRITKSALNSDGNNKERSNESSSGSEESQEVDDTPPLRDQPSHPTGIVLNRVGYYTIPSLDDLNSLLTEDGKCVVDNFTIGRNGYGNVYFPDSFDVAGLNLDEIVHFRHKEVVLYPDDEKKPPVGEGLNRRAQVTLDRVWPIDKSSHDPITSAERLQEMRYEDKLQRVCAKLRTRFMEYRPQTGSWVFKVEHFSKYGLSDSDEDDALPPVPAKQQKSGVPVKSSAPIGAVPQQAGLAVTAKQMSGKEDCVGLIGTQIPGGLNDGGSALVPVLLEDDHDMEDVPKHPIIDYGNGTMITSPTTKLAREFGSSSHKLQLMKASFFVEDDVNADILGFTSYDQLLQENVIEDVLEKNLNEGLPEKRYNLLRTHFTSPQTDISVVDISVTGHDVPPKKMQKSNIAPEVIAPPVEHPKSVALKYPHKVLHWENTSSKRIGAKCLVDVNLLRGHSFRVGWGMDSTLLTLTTQQTASVQPLVGDLTDLMSYTIGRVDDDYSPCIVQRLRVVGGGTGYEENFCESVEGHLMIQLNHSEMIDGDCPQWIPAFGVDALHAHCDLAVDLTIDQNDALLTYARYVWELCVALWGHLSTLDENQSMGSHHTVMARREAVSEWLENVIVPQVEEETSRTLGKSGDPNDMERHIPAILSYLSAKNLLEACRKAQSCGDHYAVMLLSQMGGSQCVRQLVHRQLVYWQEVHADSYINKDRLKMLMLVAGLPLFSSSRGSINICENLEWKRCFAMHLWYVCSPVASVMDALQKYDNAFSSEDPKNNYARQPNPPYIDPDEESQTSNGQPVLTSLGYSHLSEYSAAHLHTSFALQLETQGLWHWAVFVLLHLKNTASRKAAVLDMIGRHIELSDSDMYLDREDFLTDKLKIPSKYSKAAWYLIKAGHVNEGHDVIMKHIAADSVINENYKYLQRLLEPLVQADPVNSISGWNSGGQILWDYLQVVSEIERLMAKPLIANNYQLEKLQPLLTSLCSRINLLSCPSAKDRLCQSEIALRTAHLIRNVLQLQRGENKVSARVLAHVINQLPLPEDYACDELNQVVRTVVMEFVPE
ncbi:Nuclear pore complex protein Nup98-Nup96 [Gryllus bimaculatus]|nr:Nuclear pore complex protein Nup98-Nup96 [Gryllus bimaculatus]